jgi:hypothetical protein
MPASSRRTPNADDSLPPLVAEIDSIKWGEFVAYKPVVAAPENVSRRARRFFPFKSMKQSLQAVEDGKGCLVLQEFELQSNGLVGWVACKLGVVPVIKRSVKKSNAALRAHLSNA